MARVMFHDAGMIGLVYDFSLANIGGPSPKTIIPYSPSGPRPLGVDRPSTSKIDRP